jgi:hypothetical protein
MNKSRLFSAAMLLTPAIFCNPSLAQEEAPPNVGAVEIYMCSYAEGKGAADLGKVVNKWNGWMDKNVATPYSAWTLTPVITGSYFEADIGWLGAYQNGSDMGKVTQSWISEGGDLQAAFDSVIPCDNHSVYSSVNYKAPEGEGWPGENGSSSVTVFSDCTVAEGKTLEDIHAVHTAWAEHLTARGSKAGFWTFLPAYGADTINGHYKVVVGYPSYEDWGNDHNDYTNGGGWRKGRELSEGVIQCDSPRVYHTTLRRNGGVTAN